MNTYQSLSCDTNEMQDNAKIRETGQQLQLREEQRHCNKKNKHYAPSLSGGAKGVYTSDRLHSQQCALYYQSQPHPHVNRLCRAIMDEEWQTAMALLKNDPSRARKTVVIHQFMGSFQTSTVLPLHLALINPNVPNELIQTLIHAYPDSVRKVETGYHRNCIHIALKARVSESTISYIIQLHPFACQEQDQLGRLPLHYAIHNQNSLALIKEVIHVYPAAVKSWDNLWWSPLHVACQALPDPELILHLLQISPETILMTTRKGSTALDIARGSKAKANASGRKYGADIIPILEDFDAMVHRLPVMQNYQDAVSKCAYRNSGHSRFLGRKSRELHDIV